MVLAILISRINKEPSPVFFSWDPDYDPFSTQPYGTIALRHFLENTFGKDSVVVLEYGMSSMPTTSEEGAAYLFIGNLFPEDEHLLDSLISFVKSGNEALVITENYSLKFLHRLLEEGCDWIEAYESYLKKNLLDHDTSDNLLPEQDSSRYSGVWEDNVLFSQGIFLSLKLPDGEPTISYPLQYLVSNKPEFYDFKFIRPELLCEQAGNYQVLGFINDTLINCVRFDLGKGRIVLNTTPLAFTNQPILHGSTLPYVQGVFSHISSARIYWQPANSMSDFPSTPQSRVAWRESPLHYILSQLPLAIAWYVLLAMAILFVIFRAKRRQRIIPVLEPNVNTSLEFIENIGRLYFISKDYRHLLMLKAQLFLAFVRNHYRMPTNNLDDQFVKNLSLRSGADPSLLKEIVLIHKNSVNSRFVSQKTLIQLHQLLEKFYQQSRRH